MKTILLAILLSFSAYAQPLAVRCLNTAGTAYQSCGGSGGPAGASWFPDGGVIGIVNQGTSPWVTSLASTTITGTVGVTGTFWQATQPVSGTFWQATQPISGSVTATQATGTNLHVVVDSAPSTAVTGTFWQATQPVSGTVSATQSGAWSLSANQSVNVAQINGVTPLMGSGATGTGSARVTVATDSPSLGTANGTIPTQSVLGSTRAVAYGSSPTAVTAGNNGPFIGDLEGRQYVNTAHPRAVFCQMAAATTTTLLQLTGCAAVASNSYYITSITMTGGIATAATVPALLRSGTGANCATATATWYTCWHGTAGNCTVSFPTPIKVTVGHAICAIDATVGTKSVMLTGYIAP